MPIKDSLFINRRRASGFPQGTPMHTDKHRCTLKNSAPPPKL